LKRESFRQRGAVAAIEALRDRAEPEAVIPLLAHLQARGAFFTSRDLGRAWDTLAYLARKNDSTGREPVRLYLAEQIDLPKEALRRSAISALGTLEDERSVGLLRALAQSGASDEPEAMAAEAALKRIHSDREQAQEVEDLRKEVLSLQKDIRTLREGMDELRKKVTPEKAK